MGNSEIDRGKESFSFIDIVCVLLRKRYFLIWGNIAILAFAALSFFFIPYLQMTTAKKLKDCETVMSMSVSVRVGLLTPQSVIESLLRQYLFEPKNILKAYAAAGFQELAGKKVSDEKNWEYLLLVIRRRFVQNTNMLGVTLIEKERIFGFRENDGSFEVFFTDPDMEKSKRFLDLLKQDADASIIARLRPVATTTVDSYERLLEIKDLPNIPSSIRTTAIVNLSETYMVAMYVLDNKIEALQYNQAPYSLVFEPVIDDYRGPFLKKAITIAIMLSGVLLVLAFFLQYLDDLRADGDIVARLRQALGKKSK